jgi:hypothetical protein
VFTRLDNEAIDIADSRSELPPAVARLVRLVPPARLDLRPLRQRTGVTGRRMP